MLNRKNLHIAICTVLALAGLTALGAAAGGAGSRNDPLVTLSYLNDTFASQIMDKFDAEIIERNEKLTQNADSSDAVYAVVNLAAGESLIGNPGCEVLLRSGEVMCGDAPTPGLVDTTSGGTLDGNAYLLSNHLYLMTDSRTVTARSDSVLLVRGDYQIQQGRG